MRSLARGWLNVLLTAAISASYSRSLALHMDGSVSDMTLPRSSPAGGLTPFVGPPTPTIIGGDTGGWTSFIGMPDLSLGPFGNASFNTPHMQPVDFGVWQASDGSWQLQSCIRNTCQTGCDTEGKALHWNHSRLFYRWESSTTNASSFPNNAADWIPVGVVMIGEPEYGEDIGGLQAPHVTRWGDPPRYHMFYGSWWSICQATSTDGKHFERVLDSHGKCPIFWEEGHQGDGGEGGNTRDPMLFAIPAAPHIYNFRIVYSSFPHMDGRSSDGVWSRTLSLAGELQSGTSASETLMDWEAWGQTKGALVGYGGSAGEGGSASECPYVYHHPASGYYYLFRTQHYTPNGGQTSVYASRDPSNFGIGNASDAYLVARLPFCAPEIVELEDGRVLVVALAVGLNGFRVAELNFAETVDGMR